MPPNINELEVKISESTPKLRGVGLFATIALLAGVASAVFFLFAMAWGGGNNLIFIIPSALILGSLGLYARRKWSLFLITPTSLFLLYMFATNGDNSGLFSKSGLFNSTFGMLFSPHLPFINKLLILIIIPAIIFGPIIAIIYLWKNYNKLK